MAVPQLIKKDVGSHLRAGFDTRVSRLRQPIWAGEEMEHVSCDSRVTLVLCSGIEALLY